ncbi:MAG TPA: CehA/McbA family metallohydrolase, partial [Holophagaceae bacterium]|nr:CehA/McbA family metallohydrolase [Holophagaceae bacterium]
MPRLRLPALCLFIASGLWAGQPRQPLPDHHEFEAAIQVPYTGQAGEARDFSLFFTFPDADQLLVATWRVQLLDADGRPLRVWRGETRIVDGRGAHTLAFDGRDGRGHMLAQGHYRVRLEATPMDDAAFHADTMPDRDTRVDYHLAKAGGAVETQEFSMEAGRPSRPLMPAFRPLAFRRGPLAAKTAPANAGLAPAGGLPYTIFLGNLHSKTHDSDGGGDVSTCTGAQDPFVAPYGPADAYQYAFNGGLDILMCSEHNHMFDGSTGTNASADPAAATGRFAAGLSEAASFSAAHPGFLAIYGMEWGVISNGGHLNIFNADGLAEWETNASGQLLGDYLTPKSDYPALYSFMKSKGWVGQFNHPDTSGQFLVNGASLGYSADGDEVMALCEVLNTSAFSHNTTESETSRSTYESAFNKLLEAGYHVAPTTDQDNHCANWGLSYHNRTGILIPSGTDLTLQSFLDAVKARHVYATMDKTAQIILTANGHIMGDRFTNSGPLALTVNYAAGSGHAASQVQIFQGVPGRNGAVTLLAAASSMTFTPSTGDHFYYAKITQDDGDLLWSAPVWVSQQEDTSGPVSAAITAPASDTTAASGAPVAFTGTGATTGGGALSYSWSFGDGATDTSGPAVSHTFTNLGAT